MNLGLDSAEHRDRATALAVALLIHLGLIGLFWWTRLPEPEPTLSMIEMNIGDFGLGTTTAGGSTAERTAPAATAAAPAAPDAKLPTAVAPPDPSDEVIPPPKPTEKPAATLAERSPKPTDAKPGPENPEGAPEKSPSKSKPSNKPGAGKTGTSGNKGGAFDLKGFEDRELLEYPLPAYPPEVQNVETAVTLNIRVDAGGRVKSAVPSQMGGNIRFVQEAMKAVRTWRFSPLSTDVPDQTGQVTVYFRVE